MTDQSARQLAVDTQRSVLVQAPAGSGKTTLLVERYIALLAKVDAPEQILAITFTKKAAAEMRRRILGYLDPTYDQWANHEKGVQEKVMAVATKIADWGLLENPQRMQIRTIDSFCHSLARTMPIVGQLGPVPRPAEQPQRLYRAAARQALQENELSESEDHKRRRLLGWCDHDHYRVESLIAQLLARREQWLRLIANENYFNREQQDSFLTLVVERTLQETRQSLIDTLQELQIDQATLLGALSEAAHCLSAEQSTSAITALKGLCEVPSANAKEIATWNALAKALLTQKGQWRKAVTKTDGFPPKSPQKEAITPVLNALADRPDLASKLHAAGSLPDPHYSDDEWLVLEALVGVLRTATMHLNFLFAQTGMSDFTALSAAALQGLGNEDIGYSDLALYLDKTIEHILVDEYQDTNWTQFQLLERLIQGWEMESDRTLFLVGDPMQSIYRFREAEVGLFVRTKHAGINGHTPSFSQLTRNFRSSNTIVDWVNAYLGPLFPTTEDIASGAIAYAPSQATIAKTGEVVVAGFEDAKEEALAVADHIERLMERNRDQSDFKVAIIVKARSHLKHIVPVLQQRRIQFRAVKLDKLIDRPVVQDLLALTKALRNPQDRSAVFALLRSPMIGLTLEELVIVAGDEQDSAMDAHLPLLDQAARRRAKRVFELLDKARDHLGRRSMAQLVEGAWHRLGGPACSPSGLHEQQGNEVDAYLDALTQAELNGLLDDWNDFIEWLDGAHTDGGPSGSEVKVEVLTMHGAKGLEWDAVIIPSLQAQPRQSDTDLMYWLPFPLEQEEQGVLMAPVSASSDALQSPRVDLIKKEQRLRQSYESLRLMYVATTRAKHSLFISAVLKTNNDGQVRLGSGSLLETVWPTLGGAFETYKAANNPPLNAEEDRANDGALDAQLDSEDGDLNTLPDQTLYRVRPDWTPQWPDVLDWKPAVQARPTVGEIEFNWAGSDARRIGTVLHHLLEWVGTKGIEDVSTDDLERFFSRIPGLLALLGISKEKSADYTQLVTSTFQSVLDSPTGRWILSGSHHDAQCEFALSGLVDGQWVNAVIDRTFVDKDGTRWIIDYKSGHHEGGNLSDFLDQEALRYRDQLAMYAALCSQRGDEKIATALYLPRHDALKVVEH